MVQPDDEPAVAMIYASRDGAGAASVFAAGAAMPRGVATAVLQTWKTELALVVRAPVDEGPVTRLLHDEVARMDGAASRFRDDSEISRVNRAAGEWVEISDYLGQVLDSVLEAAELTDGLVNPCMGAAVDAAGYRRWRDGTEPDGRVVVADLTDLWREVDVRRGGSEVQVRIPPGAQLDVGAVAKGWLADRIAVLAAERFSADVMANMGGDLRVVTGDRPWTVLADPQIQDVQAQSLEVWDAGLATSGTGLRRWTSADGSAAHHIIDPRTGGPAQTPWTTCSVLAATAAQANAASTAGIVLGDEGPLWVQQQGLDAWFAGQDRQARVGRWPEPATA